jgi:hypothetical protein
MTNDSHLITCKIILSFKHLQVFVVYYATINPEFILKYIIKRSRNMPQEQLE